jgi:hypothetical protein
VRSREWTRQRRWCLSPSPPLHPQHTRYTQYSSAIQHIVTQHGVVLCSEATVGKCGVVATTHTLDHSVSHSITNDPKASTDDDKGTISATRDAPDDTYVTTVTASTMLSSFGCSRRSSFSQNLPPQ